MKLDDKGYALPLVLGISLIIVIIVASITAGTSQKLKTAIGVGNRSRAYVTTYSTMNKVLFHILTSTNTPYGMTLHMADEEEGEETWWNLFGTPIDLGQGVTITLRDGAGMISPLFEKRLLESVLPTYLEAPEEEVSFHLSGMAQTPQIMDTLNDWQDSDDFKRLNGAESWQYRVANLEYEPRNFYIQTLEELTLLKDIGGVVFDALEDDLTYWLGGSKNYLTMSEKSLNGVLGNPALTDLLISLREQKELERFSFEQLTGLEITEQYSNWPSGWIKVEIEAREEEVVDRLQMMIVKQEFQDKPFLVTEWKR